MINCSCSWRICWSWSWRICCTIVTVMAFIMLGGAIYVLVKSGKRLDPIFTLKQAAVTGFNLTFDDQVTSFFHLEFRAINPNSKLVLRYQDIQVLVFKDKQNLGTQAVPDFTQRTRSVKLLRVERAAFNVSLKKDASFNFGMEYLDFDVFMTATVNGDRKLEANCEHAVVNVIAKNDTYDTHNAHDFKTIECIVEILKK